MSETRATATVFPEGRYGRRRDGRRRRVVPITILVVVIAASLVLSWRLYQQYGQLDYKAQIVGWSEVTDASMTVEFTVTVPAGHAATCTVRGRDYDGNELGVHDFVVRPEGDATEIHAKVPLPTKGKASVADVLGCQPAD